MLWRTARALFTFVTLVLAAATVTFLYIGWRVNCTGARDQAQPADVIVILGARVEPDGQPGPDLKVRTLHAVALFQQGFAPSLICTGGFHNDRLSAAAVACDLAVVQGVPAERVWLADGSMTTREDAIRTSQLMASHGWHPGQPPSPPGARPPSLREPGNYRLSEPNKHGSDSHSVDRSPMVDRSRDCGDPLDWAGRAWGAL